MPKYDLGMDDLSNFLEQALKAAADALVPPDQVEWIPNGAYQIPPPKPWFGWMLMGGRGSGKTAPCAKYFHDHMMGPPCLPHIPGGHWASIVAPTLGDAVTSCVNGPSGLIKWCPTIKLRQAVGGAEVRYPNGATAKLFGAHGPEDVERFRAGGNRCMVWMEELAAWRYMNECYEQIRYGLRVGPRPHFICSTTPKARALIKTMMNDPTIVVTRASTDMNPHLDANVKKALYDDYGGTRMGKQELDGQYLEDVPNALWKLEWFERDRVLPQEAPRNYNLIVVGVDPALTSSDESDETGIIVAGRVGKWQGLDNGRPAVFPNSTHSFVLADRSIVGTPAEWAEQVVAAYQNLGANRVTAEINAGGDMVAHTIRTVRGDIPVKVVHASRGKARRAEPIASLYEQARVHHVGLFPVLEDQMSTFDPQDPDEEWSPDHMDAAVWAVWDLMIGNSLISKNRTNDQRLRGRR